MFVCFSNIFPPITTNLCFQFLRMKLRSYIDLREYQGKIQEYRFWNRLVDYF
jgi:hypothetical protein